MIWVVVITLGISAMMTNIALILHLLWHKRGE